ncbi:TetR/AcrR family transcriptional regulator [Psychromicrobium sp. YIM B11713]|uniref:TetR/AcrR family transcriptional regulator n=1 Tax=Psychromicrobium sp. YIM B11713 TaxID=3145233 RepID=UPI00374E7467
MPERKPRKDAVNNRKLVLAAADALFARRARPQEVTMDSIAAEAGVGKGTLFRAFGDRTGLLRAVYQARLEPIMLCVASGSGPWGPEVPARERIPALLDALLCFKLDNRSLMLALEEADSASLYLSAQYGQWHDLLRGLLAQLPGTIDSAFTAHALLAAVRADLVEHLASEEDFSREDLREQLAVFIRTVLSARTAV